MITDSNIFPSPILNLPEADIPIKGLKAYLSQGISHQVFFMEFQENIEIFEHSHESQWGVVLEGKIDINMNGETKTYQKGDRYFIPKGTKHSSKIYAGYADITFFNEKDRYSVK